MGRMQIPAEMPSSDLPSERVLGHQEGWYHWLACVKFFRTFADGRDTFLKNKFEEKAAYVYYRHQRLPEARTRYIRRFWSTAGRQPPASREYQACGPSVWPGSVPSDPAKPTSQTSQRKMSDGATPARPPVRQAHGRTAQIFLHNKNLHENNVSPIKTDWYIYRCVKRVKRAVPDSWVWGGFSWVTVGNPHDKERLLFISGSLKVYVNTMLENYYR